MFAPIDNDLYSESSRHSMKSICDFILYADGPILIHCSDGVNKTGLVCSVLSGLVGSNYKKICDDYSQSYFNYFNIDKKEITEKLIIDEIGQYKAENVLANEKEILVISKSFNVVFANAFRLGLRDSTYINLQRVMRQYLYDCGLTEDEVESLHTKLLKNNGR